MCQHWSEMWEKMRGAKSTDVFQTATNTTIMHHIRLHSTIRSVFCLKWLRLCLPLSFLSHMSPFFLHQITVYKNTSSSIESKLLFLCDNQPFLYSDIVAGMIVLRSYRVTMRIDSSWAAPVSWYYSDKMHKP